jgi:hypothetical protein
LLRRYPPDRDGRRWLEDDTHALEVRGYRRVAVADPAGSAARAVVGIAALLVAQVTLDSESDDVRALFVRSDLMAGSMAAPGRGE